MTEQITNLFRIENPEQLEVSYRLVDVDVPLLSAAGEEERRHEVLGLLAKQIQLRERIPAVILADNGRPLIAIPAQINLSKLVYELTPEVATLRPRDETSRAQLRSGTARERTVGVGFLRFYLRSPLMGRQSMWSSSPSTYFSKAPINQGESRSEVDIYEGFRFGLVEAGEDFFLCLDLKHAYAERQWMLANRPEERWAGLRMRHVLYHFGHRWYRAQLLGVLPQAIRDCRFSLPNGTGVANVFDYTIHETGANAPPWVRALDPSSPSIAYQYPANKVRRHGAAALCKLLLPTDDPRVAALHRRAIVEPLPRFKTIEGYLKECFSEVRLCGRRIRISRQPHRSRASAFSMPSLEFGQSLVVQAARKTNDSAGPSDLGRQRMAALLDHKGGFAVTSPLSRQALLLPESLPREISEDFGRSLRGAVAKLFQASFQAETVLYKDGQARTLKAQVDAVEQAIRQANLGGSRGLLVLPEHAQPDLHNFLKRDLRDRFLFQCVSARSLKSFYLPCLRQGDRGGRWVVAREQEGKYQSYLRYVALGVLLVNRQWPFVLNESTHYEAYVGLDVLRNTAAFTFFYDGGRLCHVQAADSSQRERLSKKQVYSMLYAHLRRDLEKLARPPSTIVLRRDGRSFAPERRGFEDAVSQLRSEGRLPSDVRCGVVEIPKSPAVGFRLVEYAGAGQLRNPLLGSWLKLREAEGIVCTTGWPFKLRGTVKPLQVKVVSGNLEIEKVLEDTFRMSQLCWSAPDRCMRLPIDLKLCDEYLQAVASAADDDEATFGDESASDTENALALQGA